MQSYFSKTALWLHTWTLSIEEHFYLAAGCLILFLSRNQKTSDPFRVLPILWLVLGTLCLLFRIGTPYDDPAVFTQTHKRIDALMFGVTLSYYFHFHRESLAFWTKRLRWLLGLTAIIGLWPIFFIDIASEPFITRFGLTLTYLSFGLVLLLALFVTPLHGKANPLEKILLFIGVRSYSIYLWHFPLAYIVAGPLAQKIGGPYALWLAIFFYLAGSLLTGHICYASFERPILAWRDRRFPAPAKITL